MFMMFGCHQTHRVFFVIPVVGLPVGCIGVRISFECYQTRCGPFAILL